MALTLRIASYQNSTLGEHRSKEFDGVGGSLGRSPSADWVLPDPKRYISNTHAAIEYKDGAYYVTDLSTNGVFINDATDALGKNNTVKLDDGDKLSIGDYKIEVSCNEQPVDNDVFSNEYAALTGEYAATDSQDNMLAANSNSDFDIVETGSDHFIANVVPPVENNVSGSIPPIKDPLDLFGPTSGNDPGQSGQHAAHDPLGVFDNNSGHGSELMNPNAGLHEHFTPPVAKSENLIPDDWDLTHFPNREDKSSKNKSTDRSNMAAQKPQPAKTLDDTGEFPQTPESLFGELPDNWGQTGFAPGSQDFSGQSKQPNTLQHAANGHTSFPSQVKGVGQRPQKGFSKPTPPNIAAPDLFSQANPISSPGAAKSANNVGAPPLPVRQKTNIARGKEYETLLECIGLDANNIPAEIADEIPQILGTVFKELVKGIMEILNARANLKGAFRVSQTIIQPVENNPLKFAVNVDDAIRNMLFNQGTGYLSALDSVQEGVADIKAHQMAMMAGMQAAFNGMLYRFDPSELAKHFDNSKGAGVFNKKAKYWDMYGELFAKIHRAAEDNFQNLLGDEFADAYENQMIKLKSGGKPKGRKSNF